MKNHETLQQLVLDVIQANPKGVNHVKIVQRILELGYRHPGNLSEDLMKIINILRKQGAIHKNIETRQITLAKCN